MRGKLSNIENKIRFQISLFEILGKEKMVYKLNQTLYGLKQRTKL